MSSVLRHFALNATDVPAAQRFYAATFGWAFEPWGPPGFFHIRTGSADADSQVRGALQRRRELLPGGRMLGLEGTFDVDDLPAVLRAARASGGRVLAEPATIAGVGTLAWLADPDGNAVGAMHVDPEAE
ncbi:VOC family protein [Pseudonocardia lacus]|uniref:VOC family protein n=1 Tax=Pseudonocardia lacus TaxID=2835865 RepID=UPI001BDC1151|nr:VOC family protein [Pseudonocardia lacus]